MSLHRVVALALPGVVPLDLAVPAQVFGHRYERARYSFTVCAEQPGLVMSDMGFAVQVEAGLEALANADTVIVPGFFPHDRLSPVVAEALRRCHRDGIRIASICAGAFALAHAGLLDGRRATTHWAKADDLARLFPRVTVRPEALFVDDGGIVTGAGVAAAIDLCLHLYRADHGAAAAAVMAKGIVAGHLRPAEHPQYPIGTDARTASVVEASIRTMLDSLERPMRLDDLARDAHLSPRSFERHFVAAVGAPPMRWLAEQRLEEARRLLETSDLPVDEVARRSGLGSSAALRGRFARRFGASPSAYRRERAATTSVSSPVATS